MFSPYRMERDSVHIWVAGAEELGACPETAGGVGVGVEEGSVDLVADLEG